MDRETELLSRYRAGEHPTIVPLSELDRLDTSPELAEAKAFLNTASQDGRFIRKSDVRLETMGSRWPRLVPLVWTLRRRDDGELVYGIVGESLVTAGGFAKRGMLLRDVPGSELTASLFAYLAETKRVSYRNGVPNLKHEVDVLRLEVMMVPVVNENEDVVSFLNFTRYYWQSLGMAHLRRTDVNR